MDKWTKRFIELANTVATWSKDNKKQVGCVLVSPSKKQFSFGYNGIASGLPDYLHDVATKNDYVIHAELNAILNAGNVIGWSAYVTKPPCINCASALIQSGIENLHIPTLDKDSSWYSIQTKAINLLTRAKINVYYY